MLVLPNQRKAPAMTQTLPTNTRVGASTIRPGDVVRTGWGTLNIIDREVATVDVWMHNGYTNADLTFTNGDSETLWSGTIWPAIR